MMQLLSLLTNNLWEGAVIAFAAWAVLRFARDANATTRYVVWTCALAATVIVPVATTLIFANAAPKEFAGASVMTPASDSSLPAARVHRIVMQRESNPPAGSAVPKAGFSFGHVFVIPQNVVWSIVGLWAALGALQLIRFIFALVALERLKRNATPMPIEYRGRLARWNAAESERSNVRLCVCDEISVPIAVGLFDAMILVPQALLEQMPDEDVDRILLHELTHLRRRDDWIHAFQRLVSGLCFFNPAVAFIARQMDLEREVSCDDSVLERDGLQPLPYATCLTKMAEIVAWPYQPLAAPGVFDTRRSLSIRVERLLTSARNNRTRIAAGPALTAVFVIGAAGIAGAAVSSKFSFALPTLCPHVASVPVHPHAHLTIAKPVTRATWVAVLPKSPAKPVAAVVNVKPAVIVKPAVKVKPALVLKPTVKVKPVVTVKPAQLHAVNVPVIVADNGGNDPKPDYIQELADAGYSGLSLDELIQLRSVGVDGTYIRAIEAAGFPHPSTRDLVQLRATGVTPAVIQELRGRFGVLTLHQVTEMHAVGVTPDYADALARAGYRDLLARDVVELRAVGVNPDYIQSLARAGFSGLSANQLVQLRALEIDSDYINKARAHFHDVTVRQLIELKAAGLL